LPLSDEQHAYVVDRVVRILESPKRAELIAELRARVASDRARFSGAPREANADLDEVILAVADAVVELMEREGPA